MPTNPSIRRLDVDDATLVFDLRQGQAELAWLGARLPATEDCEVLCDLGQRALHESEPDRPIPRSILPFTGQGYSGAPVLEVAHDGRLLAMAAAPARAIDMPDALCLQQDDTAQGLCIKSLWQPYSSGAIRIRSELSHSLPKRLQVLRCASLVLPLPRWVVSVVHFAGRWSAEMHVERTRLGTAVRVGGNSMGGRSGFAGGQWLIFEASDTTEGTGRCLAVHLLWSGDHEWFIETNVDGDSVLHVGARLQAGEITISSGEPYIAPEALLAISNRGRARLRRILHRHVRSEILPKEFRTSPRKVHLNTWEACGFEMSLPRLEILVRDAAALGVERFVLDDGWFGRRRDDRSSLGDWSPSSEIFPDGLTPLIEEVQRLGMDFGLWVEPEMVSPDSSLYHAHPDWCLHAEGLPRATQRHQLVLDLTLDAVADHLFSTLDGLLRRYAIAYLKWDHNRDLFPLAGRGHAQTRALLALLDRLRAAHPTLEIESCASGGGRVDYGILSRCTRFWASDNNDPIERIRINRSWLQFLPLKSCGNHVGPDPNPITGRSTPMDFRAKVAMFGHMGIEADPARMSAADRQVLAVHIDLYKRWRDVLHEGDLHEIVADEASVSGWLAVLGDRGLALVTQTDFSRHFESAPVKLLGLEPGRSYCVRLLDPWPPMAVRYLSNAELLRQGVRLSAESLAAGALRLPLRHPATAWLISLEAQ